MEESRHWQPFVIWVHNNINIIILRNELAGIFEMLKRIHRNKIWKNWKVIVENFIRHFICWEQNLDFWLMKK